ncbi:hypothetical protein Ae201684P_022112 [Aphanomyces euteiches]|uniref:Uncharacterized protein n=1 Tax=Aphanomyces euteiches TaxID=100861 RepID=A0A6G0W801_9STRA|nr:hypothetical protein Ae201684_017818 [Aphanomyces euteiches]KAH9072535.1 hypothetical protein Ae201684P_022112 [Aphanomyces euteiches]
MTVSVVLVLAYILAVCVLLAMGAYAYRSWKARQEMILAKIRERNARGSDEMLPDNHSLLKPSSPATTTSNHSNNQTQL